jgi:uncharacterized protein (DUF2141 family)
MKLSILLAASAVLSALAATGPSAHAADGISVVVKGMRNNKGRLGCTLFKGPDGFPENKKKQFEGMWAPKRDHEGVCDFNGVPAGEYAVAVLDDENMNGKMDFNFIGLPTKGYGFSNDAKATLSAPSFKAAAFHYSGRGELSVPINIVYRGF